MFVKLNAFTKKVADLADKPTLDASQLKAQFDAAPDEVRVYLNNLIDALKSTTSDSGAKNIGAATISGLTGNNVQTLLESLYNTLGKASWTDLTLLNGHTVANGRTPRYAKVGDFVYLDGEIGNLSTSGGFATLPTGFKPSKTQIFKLALVSNTANSGANVIFDTSGAAFIQSLGATGLNLNLAGVVFPVS